ncbi:MULTISPECIES: hypothetical protein [Rhizobium]|uniref:hypothetical protein n=1 Tax=Rhizobium TaxID=379 RepID=UPI000403BB93|nr:MULTISPECIES: hypothetical protein [Rhizobium]MCA0805421.1 hypothetical protein [Rhizobium sp. T1473]MCS0461805.1 hypothetical protein [Rhizobium favelukesii]UFS79247.1 hypothetical protein LPB79_06510 [Rhizobium sp. T136]
MEGAIASALAASRREQSERDRHRALGMGLKFLRSKSSQLAQNPRRLIDAARALI